MKQNHTISWINPNTQKREFYYSEADCISLLCAYVDFFRPLGFSHLVVDDVLYSDDMIFHDVQAAYCDMHARPDGFIHCDDCVCRHDCDRILVEDQTLEYCRDFEVD